MLGAGGLPFRERSPVHFSLISIAPANIAPGVTLSVSQSGPISTLELDGPISTLRIGGQEFGVDHIVLTPEPATLELLGLAAAVVLNRRPR